MAAVRLGGSAARGHADRYSDLELFVVWAGTAQRRGPRHGDAAAGGDLVRLYRSKHGVWAGRVEVGRRGGEPFTGVEVDMSHCLVGTVEAWSVSRRHATLTRRSSSRSAESSTGSRCTAQLVARWQQCAARYPDGLRVAVVRAHAQIEGLWRLDAFAARDNPVAGYQVLTAAHEDLLHTLLGLNRVYYSGFKSLTAVVSELPIAPADLLERIRASYPLEEGRSKAMLTALVEETHDLVEEHSPRSTSTGCGRSSGTTARCGSSYPVRDDLRDGSLLPALCVRRARLPALVGLPAPPWPARRHRRSDHSHPSRRGRRAA